MKMGFTSRRHWIISTVPLRKWRKQFKTMFCVFSLFVVPLVSLFSFKSKMPFLLSCKSSLPLLFSFKSKLPLLYLWNREDGHPVEKHSGLALDRIVFGKTKKHFPREQKEVNDFSGIGNLFDIVRLPDVLLIFDVWPPWGGFLSNSCQPSFSALLGCAFLSTLDLSQILVISKPIPFFANSALSVTVEQIVCNWKWLLK